MVGSVELRERFLQFFKNRGHHVLPSAPLIPQDDPTLLFVNAGMVPFKDIFTGRSKAKFNQVTTSQKCVRAGGKHNDLENVGRTARHHVFFEMLGNFSFGAYFKEQACLYAYEFLTKELGLAEDKLTVTIFGGEGELPADEECGRIWHEIVGVPKSRIKRMGAKDNFWSMGDTGPCGPCTEIHYSRANTASFGDEDDVTMEVWNLVFMQFERMADSSLIPLPAPCVDTGMGLERLCTVVNGLSSNYDSDLLKPYIDFVATKLKKDYHNSNSDDDVSMRVIADHCRATAFLIADGVVPGNEGRGYVLRRIMRRAIRHGAKCGFSEVFFYEVCALVSDHMGKPYPELVRAKDLIAKVVKLEEESFRKTLDRGLELFNQHKDSAKSGQKFSGAMAFRLYETYGFPADLTENLAEEAGLTIDWDEFEAAKLAHERASTGGLGIKSVDAVVRALNEELAPTIFIGDHQVSKKSKVIAILQNGKRTNQLLVGETGQVIMEQTPFYGESGGQVGDSGHLNGSNCKAIVLDTKKVFDIHIHEVEVSEGSLSVDALVTGSINKVRREAIRKHHSVTHLLHAALRQELGNHVTQKGSLVDENRTRFDFSHFESLSVDELNRVEHVVNSWIMSNELAHSEFMSLEKAKLSGAMALFGEKYAEEVRVIAMGGHSVELCGGTHVDRTGDIGPFRIVSESSLSAGVRRIEAVAGFKALASFKADGALLKQVAVDLSTSVDQVPARVKALADELVQLRSKLSAISTGAFSVKAKEIANSARAIQGANLVTWSLGTLNSSEELRSFADLIRDNLESGVVVLGAQINGKAALLVAVTKDLQKRFHAGNLIKELAPIIGGKGGGRPDLAQAGGPQTEEIDNALNAVEKICFQ